MRDEKELAEALKNEENQIIIEGDLARKVFKIKVTGNVAWGVCIAAIAVAVAAALASMPTGGVSAFVAAPAMAGAVTILGPSVAGSALSIAIAAGGVGVLNKLRNYNMEKISDTKIILHRK